MKTTITSVITLLCSLLLVHSVFAQDIEPNNTAAQASFIQPNMMVSGSIGMGNDTEDWFFLELPMSGNILIELVPMNPSLDLTLTFLNENEEVLTQGSIPDVMFPIFLQSSVMEAGKYYIHVSTTGQYQGQYRFETFYEHGQGGGNPPTGDVVLIDNFEDGDLISEFQTPWGVYDDADNGGNSQISMNITDEYGNGEYAIQVDYTIDPGSITWGIGNAGLVVPIPVNLGVSTGISFYYQGPEIYVRAQTSNVTDFAFYQYLIPGSAQGQVFTLEWNQFIQPAWTGNPVPFNPELITELSWQIDRPHVESGTFILDDVYVTDYIPYEMDITSLTFRVDMQYQTVHPDGVHLSGSFNNWDPAQAIRMAHVGNNIYEVNVSVYANRYLEYKFINGDPTDFGNYEILDGLPCGSQGQYANRFLMVQNDMQLPPLCYGQCGPCQQSGALNPTITVDRNSGYAPLYVTFSGFAQGNIVQWEWVFGDGIYAYGQNLNHMYEYPGTYEASLTVTDEFGNYETTFVYISVWEQTNDVTAEFWADNYSGYAPLTVQFFDYSSGGVDYWEWDFGDGGTSNEQNPVYTYYNPGVYSVSLSVLDNQTGQSDYIEKPYLIEAWQYQGEDYCSKAIMSYVGANHFDAVNPHGEETWGMKYNWYEFTPNKDAKYIIDLCNVQNLNWAEIMLYTDCQMNHIQENNVSCDNGMNNLASVIFNGKELKTIYFQIAVQGFYDNGFPFEIRELPLQAGDICSAPISLELGESVVQTNRGELWFEYTATQAGTLIIQIPTQYETVEIQSYYDCSPQVVNWYYGNSIQVSVDNQEELLLKLQILYGSGEPKNMTVHFIPEGEMYADFSSEYRRVSVGGDVYFQNYSFNALAWEWDFTGDGITDSEDFAPYFNYDTPGLYSVTLTVFDGDGGQISVTKENYILVYEQAEGDYCDIANSAQIGENTMDFVHGFNQWFSYTSDFSGSLEISFCNSTSPASIYDIYSNCEGGRNWNYDMQTCHDGKIKMLIRDVTVGTTIYFNVTVDMYYTNDLELVFELTQILPEPGDNCDLPIQITEAGTFTLDFSYDQSWGNKWYTYTATETVVVEVSTCNNQDPTGYIGLTILSNCPQGHYDYNYIDANNRDCQLGVGGEVRVFEMQAGETIFIEAFGHAYEPMSWEFTLREYYDGEICEKPIIAIEGQNEMPEMLRQVFYQYTPTESGVVTISNCQFALNGFYDYSSVMVLDYCEDDASEIYAYAGNNCGNGVEVMFEVSAGITYHIQWYGSQPTSWILELDPEGQMPEGTTCNNPFVLSEPVTTITPNSNIVWFEYTAPAQGVVTFTSNIQQEATVIVASACIPLSPYMETDDNVVPSVLHEGLSFETAAGETYKILVIFHEYAFAGSMEMITSFETGATIPAFAYCSGATTVSLGTHTTTTQYGNYWYAYTAQQAGYVQVLNIPGSQIIGEDVYVTFQATCNTLSEDGWIRQNLEIGTDCGHYIYINDITYLEAGQTLYLQFASREVSETFEWQLVEVDFQKVGILAVESGLDFSAPVIDPIAKTVHLTLVNSANLEYTSLKIDTELGNRLYAVIQGWNQPVCNWTQFDLSRGPVQVELRDMDNTIVDYWTITAEKTTILNSASNIAAVYSSQVVDYIINTVTKTVNVQLHWDASECLQDLYIQVSAGAHIQNSSYQNNNVCFPDASGSLLMRVIAENGTNFTDWVITYTRQEPPQGSSCDNPLVAQKGSNTVRFEDNEDSKIFSYVVQNTSLLKVDLCSQSIIMPVIVPHGDCDDESTIIMPQECPNNPHGFFVEAQVVQGQEIIIAIFREDAQPARNLTFVIQEIVEELPIITNITTSITETTVFVGDEVCVQVTVTPSQSSSNVTRTITGSTLDVLVGNCFVPNAVGTSIITYASTDGSNISRTVTINSVARPIELEQIALPEQITLLTGQSSQLVPVFIPQNADNKDVVWTSSNPNVVFVDDFGNIIAMNEGQATITAFNSIYGIISNECVVTVAPVLAESIILNRYSLSLKEGDLNTSVFATVLPINASDKQVVWTSSNTDVVQIISSTIVKAVGVGQTTVVISLVSNPAVSASFVVSVSEGAPDKTQLAQRTQYASSLLQSITQQGLIGSNTGQYPASAVTELENAISAASTVLSNQSATKAEVDQVAAELESALTTFENSRIDRVSVVTVLIVREVIDFVRGESKQVYAYVHPTNATNTALQWVAENPSVATVSQSGLVTAQSSGITYVFAYAQDGSGAYDSTMIVVRTPLHSLSLPQTVTILEGEDVVLNPVVLPLNADVSEFVWHSDDTTVVKVSGNGIIEGVAEGIATVSVRETASSKSASVVVMVRAQAIPVTSVSIQRDSIVMSIGESNMIYPTVLPIDATNKNYTWSSSAPALAFVNNNGLVTAFDLGEAFISVVTQDGGFKDSVKIIIVPSQPPVVEDIPQIIVEAGTTTISLNLADYVSDDNTDVQDLVVEVVSSVSFTVTIENGVVTIVPNNPQDAASEIIELSITDADNQTVFVSIPVEVSAQPNTAPIFTHPSLVFRIVDGGMFAPVYLTQYVTDDYTAPHNLVYELLETNNHFRTILTGFRLDVSRYDANWIGVDSVLVGVTDDGGLSAVQYIVFEVSQKPNEAPVLSQIPEQQYNNVTKRYPVLDLKSYVTDDYTLPHNIEWTFTPNSRVNISIWNGVASVTVADQNWTGSTTVTFTATDEGGLSSQITVVYTKITQTGNTWVATPKISFEANQTIVGPGVPVTFMSSISGATSWIWHFEGGTPAQSIIPNPTVTYAKAGRYRVQLTAMNDHGTEQLVKEEYITILGLEVIDAAVCLGEPITIQATIEEGMGYTFEWSTQSTDRAIQVQPHTPTTYSLTIRQGLFEYQDQVTLSYNDTELLPSLLRPHPEQIGVVTFAQEDNSVVVAWERTAEKRTLKYEILRETSVLNVFEKIGEMPFDAEQSLFEDTDADARTKSYRYKIATIDSTCLNRVESAPHRSLHIQNNLNTQFKANLTWAPYEGIDFSTYKIFRGTNADNMIEIDAVTSEATSWTDSDNYQFGWLYRVAMVLPQDVETRFPLLKAESGPYSLAMSNIAEAETEGTLVVDVLASQIEVYPTIADSYVRVQVGQGISAYSVELISSQGAVVYVVDKTSDEFTYIPLSQLARGTYTVSVVVDGVRINSGIFVK